MELQGESEVIEGDPDSAMVVDSARYDRTHPRSDGSARVVETNARRRDNRPGGHIGKRGGLGDVEHDLERRSDVEGDQIGGRRGWKDDVMSGARSDSI